MDRQREILKELSKKREEILKRKSEISSLEMEYVEVFKSALIDQEQLFKDVELFRFFEGIRMQISKDWTVFKNKITISKDDTPREVRITKKEETKITWNWKEKKLSLEHRHEAKMQDVTLLKIKDCLSKVSKNLEAIDKVKKIRIASEDVLAKVLKLGLLRRLDLQYSDFQKFGVDLAISEEMFEFLKRESKYSVALSVYNDHKKGTDFTIKILKNELDFKDSDFDENMINSFKVQDAVEALSS